jgi:outer membrane lipoprotein SlyB
MAKGFLAGAIAALAVAAALPVQAAEVIGRIRSINPVAHTATLDSGDTFVLGDNIDPTAFQVGDRVKVTYRGIGAAKRAVAIDQEK